VIAWSEITGVEMFSYGDHIFGIQGHPEFTHDILLHFIDRIITRNLVEVCLYTHILNAHFLVLHCFFGFFDEINGWVLWLFGILGSFCFGSKG